jgi:hypothetical protein
MRYQSEKHNVAMWILRQSPSLNNINLRLRAVESSTSHQTEQLLDARGWIVEAITEVSLYFRRSIEAGAESEREEPPYSRVQRLETQLACETQSMEATSPEDNYGSPSSTDYTDFEDIGAYEDEQSIIYGSESLEPCSHTAVERRARSKTI